MNFFKQLWLSIRSNPIFVAGWTAFAGALFPQLANELQSGHLDLTANGLEKMVLSAAVTAAVALLHLYTPSPGQNPKN